MACTIVESQTKMVVSITKTVAALTVLAMVLVACGGPRQAVGPSNQNQIFKMMLEDGPVHTGETGLYKAVRTGALSNNAMVYRVSDGGNHIAQPGGDREAVFKDMAAAAGNVPGCALPEGDYSIKAVSGEGFFVRYFPLVCQ